MDNKTCTASKNIFIQFINASSTKVQVLSTVPIYAS
jgi:hypothetical protein